ncbi:MAG: peptide-methionine (S)-S-oxide reductase MsrA, partial [Candidatus Binatus sp.]
MLTLVVLFGLTPIDAYAQAGANDRATAVFSGGCFWGVDAVFKHVKGVSKVVSGYAGGAAGTANYETVSTGTTRHAESVQVTYDPTKVSYDDLLKVFFFVAHDPTELNRQGPDSGTQYRSSIFYENDAQKKMADDYIARLDQKHSFSKPIVTKVVRLDGFYPAEAYHQNY